jgi:glycyl-tRNA synthetase
MAKVKLQDALKDIVSLCKRRGFVFPGSDIYDGLANTWDYGPYGVELKKNIKDLWWKKFITSRPDVVGLDSSILLNPRVWEASGHTNSFSDPLMDCKSCRERFRGDHLLEAKLSEGEVAAMDFKEIAAKIVELDIKCPKCGSLDYTEPRAFNLMFKTKIGVVQDSGAEVYLRPETAQGIFLNFKTIAENCRQKIPFGIGQVGKSFRNEITPGNFIFRTREFEQMEMEFFCEPGTQTDWFDFWKNYCMEWLYELGLTREKLHFRDHDQEELSHYSDATTDIEYDFPFGRGELWGIASRTDFDLNAHQDASKKDLRYHDKVENKKYLPYVVEPALGADRLLLTLLTDAYEVETLPDGSERTVLHFHSSIAPVKVAVLPLSKKPELKGPAQEIYKDLLKTWAVEYDETQAIGKRYRRQDELGTPFCITVDFDTLEDKAVTVRERDSMKQERVAISELKSYLIQRLG